MDRNQKNKLNISPNNMVWMSISIVGSIIAIILLSLKEQIGSPLVWILIGIDFAIFILIGIITYFVLKRKDKQK